MRNRLLTNPFILYSIIWLFVLFVYKLRWSELFYELSNDIIFFILVTSFISLILGIVFHKRKIFSYRPLNSFSVRKIKRVILILYGLLSLEFISAKGIPLFGYVGLGNKIEYSDFGLPFIHVIIIAGFSMMCMYVYHCMLSSKDRKVRLNLLKYLSTSIFPFILIFNRGGIIALAIGIGSIYLMATDKLHKGLVKICITAIVVLFLFGMAGNVRTDIADVNNIILEIGEATDEFRESTIPKELFWGYLYIASPIANCQYTIRQNPNVQITMERMRDFVIFEIFPELVSKRLGSMLGLERVNNPLIVDSLNVSTIYARPYMYLGWYGIILMFISILFFVFFTMSLVSRVSSLYVTTIAAINIIIVQSIFDNMLTFMGTISILMLVGVICIPQLIKKYASKQNNNSRCII